MEGNTGRLDLLNEYEKQTIDWEKIVAKHYLTKNLDLKCMTNSQKTRKQKIQFLKYAKDLNIHFNKEDARMLYKHLKIFHYHLSQRKLKQQHATTTAAAITTTTTTSAAATITVLLVLPHTH